MWGCSCTDFHHRIHGDRGKTARVRLASGSGELARHRRARVAAACQLRSRRGALSPRRLGAAPMPSTKRGAPSGSSTGCGGRCRADRIWPVCHRSSGRVPASDAWRGRDRRLNPNRASTHPSGQAAQPLCDPYLRWPAGRRTGQCVRGSPARRFPVGELLGVLERRHGCELCRIRSSLRTGAAPHRKGRCLPAHLGDMRVRMAHGPIASGSLVLASFLSPPESDLPITGARAHPLGDEAGLCWSS